MNEKLKQRIKTRRTKKNKLQDGQKTVDPPFHPSETRFLWVGFRKKLTGVSYKWVYFGGLQGILIGFLLVGDGSKIPEGFLIGGGFL